MPRPSLELGVTLDATVLIQDEILLLVDATRVRADEMALLADGMRTRYGVLRTRQR